MKFQKPWVSSKNETPTVKDVHTELIKAGVMDADQNISLMQSNPYIPVNVQPVNPPVLSPVSWETGRLIDLQNQLQNRANQGDALFNMDERIYSAVDLMGTMISKSYSGVALKADDKSKTDLSNQEQNALDEAIHVADDILNIRELYYNYTTDLFKYGDAVDVIKMDPNLGVTGLAPLPMNYVTAIDNMKQFRQNLSLGMEVINDPQYYIVDELNTRMDLADRIYNKKQILHISVNPRRNWVRDVIGRWTFNVWSHPPIQTLRVLIEWKQILIRNDILWRNRSVPREVHKLDLSVYDPSKYSGDYKNKLAQATADAQAAIAQYTSAIARREADQGFVVDNKTAIEMLEPRSTSYHSPNEIISQINTLINAPTGIPDALAGGGTKGFTSLQYSSTFSAMRAEVFANRITKALESLIRRHVTIMHPGIPKDIINRLYIRSRLILDRDRAELAKIVSTLAGVNGFTITELREIWGLDPLTSDQQAELLKWLEETGGASPLNSPEQSSDDLEGNDTKSPTHGMETPGQRKRNINQRGDRR